MVRSEAAVVRGTAAIVGVPTAGVASKQVTVGSLIDRTGVSAANTIWEGEDSYFQCVNAHRGVSRYKLNGIGFGAAGSAATDASDVTELIQQDHAPAIIDDDAEGGPAAVPIATSEGVPLVGSSAAFGAEGVFRVCTQANAIAILNASKQQGWNGRLYYISSTEPGLSTDTGSFGDGRIISPQSLSVLAPKKTELAGTSKYFGVTANVAETEDVVARWTDAQVVAHAASPLGSKPATSANIEGTLQSFKDWGGDFTPPTTCGRGPHGHPAHCSRVLLQENGIFKLFDNQREECPTGSVAPPPAS